MSNILLISPWLPWPPHDGARIRILETLRFLSARHRVTLFAHIHAESERAHVAQLRDYCADVQVSLLSGRTGRRLGRMICASLAGAPLIQGIHFDAGFARRIFAATEEQKFDVVQIELSLIARYAAAVSRRHGCKLVLSTHNIESQRFARELKLASWSFRRVVLQADQWLFGNWEEKAVRRFDGAIAVSNQDRKWLQEHLAGRPVALAPNGVDTTYFRRQSPFPVDPVTIVFTGVMDYPPNEDAVLWFAEKVWPWLRHRRPELVFQIVGTRPTARIMALAANAGIEVTGEVPDVRPYVEQALAFVVPLRSGGGTRLKILQAMAIGCPVISTRLGAEGLAVGDRDDILFAEQPGEFVARIEELKASPEIGTRLAVSARALVLRQYDWRSCLGAVDRLYDELRGPETRT